MSKQHLLVWSMLARLLLDAAAAAPLSGLRVPEAKPVTLLSLRWSESAEADLQKLEAQLASARGTPALLVSPGPVGAGAALEQYNAWISWLHQTATRLGPRVRFWAVDLDDGPATFSKVSPLYTQFLKSSATEIRASDRDALVLWRTRPPEPLAPWWPEGSLAYLDGLIVPRTERASGVRELLPRADFELWLEAEAPAAPAPELFLTQLLDAQRAGAQAVLEPGLETLEPRLLTALTDPDWAVTEAVALTPPEGRRAFALIDSKGRKVRVALLGRGEGELRLGLGAPSRIGCQSLPTREPCAARMEQRRGELVLTGLPPGPIVLLELEGGMPVSFEVTTSASAEMSGEEIMARSEAYFFWLKRQVPHLACRLEADWEAGEELGSIETELLFEPATSTVWLHILSELKNGLPFDPNRERYIIFDRGGGLSTPLVQAVDEDHLYRRQAKDETIEGRRVAVVEFEPKPEAKKRTSGRRWVDLDSYAIVKIEEDDARPGLPLTHQRSVLQFAPQPGGLWLPSESEEASTVSLLGFQFSSRGHLRFKDFELAPQDLSERVKKAIGSSHPVLVWNEQKGSAVVLRKTGKNQKKEEPGSAQARQGAEPPGPPEVGVADDYLLRVSFNQSLENPGVQGPQAPDGSGSEPWLPVSAAPPSSLEQMAQAMGNVDVLRGGDEKRLSNWTFGLAGPLPFALYSRVYLEWLGRKDWQLAVFTAGVISVARWTDSQLGSTRWSGSLTAFVPAFPFPDNDLKRLAPSLSASVRRPLGKSLGLELHGTAASELLWDTDKLPEQYVKPPSHLEVLLGAELDWRRPRTGALLGVEWGWRSKWAAWGLGQETPEPSFVRIRAGVEHSFRLGRTGVLSLGARAGGGHNLDVLSNQDPTAAGLDGLGSRLVLPSSVELARFVSFDGAVGRTFGRKLRLGLEGALLSGSEEGLWIDGIQSSLELERHFASAGVTAGFNFYWHSQAVVRVGGAFETGVEKGDSTPYFSVLIVKNL